MLELFLLLLEEPDTQPWLQTVTQTHPPTLHQWVDPQPVPQKNGERLGPVLTDTEGVALLAYDVTSGKTLYSTHADRPQPLASISKLMTTMIILEEHDMDEIVWVPAEAVESTGAKIDLLLNERITVQTLVEAMLIPSANDAAIALAVHNAGSEAAFAEKMNAKAKQLELTSATFVNATGLDQLSVEINPDTGLEETTWVGNQMSARDIVKMVRLLMEDDFVRQTVNKPEFFGTSDDGQFSHEKASTNILLGNFLGVEGFKTGYTELAGQCLVTLGTRGGNEVITVVLGSVDRFSETKKLLSWIYDAHTW